MATKPKVAAAGTPSEESPAPSFHEAAQASTDAEQQRLEGLVDRAKGTPTEEAPPAKSDLEAYNEWYESLPADKRDVLVNTVVSNYSKQLEDTYSPEVLQVLAAVRENPELKKKLSRLSDDKFRSWVFDTAASIYDDPRFAGPEATDGTAPADPRYEELKREVTSLKGEREKEKADREYDLYRQKRVDEYQALLNTHPELRFTDADSKEAKRVNAIIEETERRSQAAKRIIPYGDVYKEYSEMWDWQATNAPPRAIPSASPSAIPGPQAPRTKFESRAGINSMLDKHGGITALASALRK